MERALLPSRFELIDEAVQAAILACEGSANYTQRNRRPNRPAVALIWTSRLHQPRGKLRSQSFNEGKGQDWIAVFMRRKRMKEMAWQANRLLDLSRLHAPQSSDV